MSALEAIDFFILSKVKKYLDGHKDVRVLITPCLSAPWKMRRHVRGAVPFVIAGKNMTADDVERYSESAAKASELRVPNGSELMKLFLKK